jgi:hypothetical protein
MHPLTFEVYSLPLFTPSIFISLSPLGLAFEETKPKVIEIKIKFSKQKKV